MSDHESFLLLAARQLSEPLTPEEAEALAAHLRECPECRSMATGMARDDVALRGQLLDAPVAPRVWQRVSAEASRGRRVDWRLVLGVAALLLVPAIAVPLFAGGGLNTPPSPIAVSSVTPAPIVSGPSSAVASPSIGLSSPASLPSGAGAYVAGRWTYNLTTPRRDTVAAQFDHGPVGEWSRTIPATGPGNTYAGPVTCLVISGSDAWLAGPATTVTDGTADRAALIYVHDGGPHGQGDRALLWLTQRGQTLATVTGWCKDRYIPAVSSALTEGDVKVSAGLP